MSAKYRQKTFDGLLVSDKCRREQPSGEARKQERLALLQERRAIYVRRGQRALLKRLLTAQTATADDVYQVVELPPNMDPRCLGAVPGSLARAGIIRSLGYVKSNRSKRHASPIQVWELADPAAALVWLADNPELIGVEAEKCPTGETAGREGNSPSVTERRQSNG